MIDELMLRWYMNADTQELLQGREYDFVSNKSKVLAVAHADFVNPHNWYSEAKLGNETLVFSPRVDNRLGVYTILHALPKLGINVDTLVTNHEECINSSAWEFAAEHGKAKYNWIVEFDRTNTGVVLYNYEDKAWERTVKRYFHVEQGTYSDIVELESLGVKAMNIGNGGYGFHTDRSFFSVEEYSRQIKKFMQFYKKYYHTKFPHIEVPQEWWEYDRGTSFALCKMYVECYLCSHVFLEDDAMSALNGWLCPECGQVIDYDAAFVGTWKDIYEREPKEVGYDC